MDATIAHDSNSKQTTLEDPPRLGLRIPPGETNKAAYSEEPAAEENGHVATSLPELPTRPAAHRWRKWLLPAAAVAGLAVGGYFLVPSVNTALNTV